MKTKGSHSNPKLWIFRCTDYITSGRVVEVLCTQWVNPHSIQWILNITEHASKWMLWTVKKGRSQRNKLVCISQKKGNASKILHLSLKRHNPLTSIDDSRFGGMAPSGWLLESGLKSNLLTTYKLALKHWHFREKKGQVPSNVVIMLRKGDNSQGIKRIQSIFKVTWNYCSS